MPLRDRMDSVVEERAGRIGGAPALEEHLMAQFELHLPNLLRTRGECWEYQREVGIGRSVADVVAVITDDSPDRRLPRELTLNECIVLSALRRRTPTRIDVLEQRCSVERGAFRGGALGRLEQLGLVERSQGGRVNLSQTVRSQSCVLVLSFEAKLTRWREALSQASAHANFADFSYVVLPEQGAARALQNLPEFRNSGVGLITVAGDALSIVEEASRSSDHDWRREFLLSRIGRTAHK